MAMRNPAHPGSLIRDNIDILGRNAAEAAQALGVTGRQLRRTISGASGLSPEMAMRLEKGIGGSADAWLRMQANDDIARARKRADEIKVVRMTPKVA